MTTTNRIRSYNELITYSSFQERLAYLKLGTGVGRPTFGFDRWLNQRFYASREWKMARDNVIVRDNGCDLGVAGYEIHTEPLVHHMNPMVPDDIVHGEEWIINPDFLVLTTHKTHNMIHYGAEDTKTPPVVVERQPGDTKLW